MDGSVFSDGAGVRLPSEYGGTTLGRVETDGLRLPVMPPAGVSNTRGRGGVSNASGGAPITLGLYRFSRSSTGLVAVAFAPCASGSTAPFTGSLTVIARGRSYTATR